MDRRMETRSVEVKVCDFCGKEVEELERCILCGREACCAHGLKEHFAYTLEVYRYTEADRTFGKICRECAASSTALLAKAFLDFLQKGKWGGKVA